MKSPRWQSVVESGFPWEREALEWLVDKLPDGEPWHAWSNFEFIDDEGKVNEVDLLVLAPGGLFLVEIKSRPGTLRGDAHTWVWTTDGREYTYDNPVLLANRKSKRLASLLRRQPSFVKARERLPWVEPVIFLSATDMKCLLDDHARAKVFLRGRPGHIQDDGIVSALNEVRAASPSALARRVDAKQAKAIVRAVAEAGIRPSNRLRQVGDYRLDSLLGEGVNYQDWSARHVSVDMRRRVRVFSYSKASAPEARESLARQAQREFRILDGIDHAGIVKVLDYKDSDLGPALIFEHDPAAVRFDHFMQRNHAELDIGARLFILRDLAETLRYAHSRRLYHRGLTPACVLVRETDDASRPLRLQIANWQTGARDATSSGATRQTVGTQHVEDYVEDPSRVYLAPEATQASPAGMLLDVFSLGAMAYLVLTGTPPAADSVELMEKLRRGPGLRLSDVLDGAAKNLQDLVSLSTNPHVAGRIQGTEEFLEYLELAEEELTAPEPATAVDPSVAKPGDRVAGGFTTIRRLGRGSSADVLLVRKDDSDDEVVLKVAIDPRHNDRLKAEAETLAKLGRHQNIVGYRAALEVNGRQAIAMESAGDKTLAAHLRREGRLATDMLRRYGEQLLSAVAHLEDEGVAHRDIKPDNIGLDRSAKGAWRLVLFDFSLSRTPPENIQAGTVDYLDPFLRQRKPPPRWDLYAERYAAAVTLYEMTTGSLPVWGDGRTAPDMLEGEITLNTESFDPSLREDLAAFFDRALRRKPSERFDNAEEMLVAWRRIFDAVRPANRDAGTFDAVARLATPVTTIAELGYSVDAQSVLERMGIHNVRELLAVERIKFRYLKGVSEKVRREIRENAKRLATLRPDLIPGGPTSTGEEEPAGGVSLDELAAELLPRRPAGDDRNDEWAVALYLGLDTHDELGAWSVLGDVARAAGVARSALADALVRMRARWLKSPAVTELRDEIVQILGSHGNVLTADELARALLAARGSGENEDGTRMRLAQAASRAALDTEAERAEQRFRLFDGDLRPLVATDAELAEYAKRLGSVADRLALQDPLPSQATALRELESASAPEGFAPILPQRLLRLAAAASSAAALSSRSEIYPVGMPALQALRHCQGTLSGPRVLTEGDLGRRVRGRFPECALLPAHPELDALLREAGMDLVWRPTAEGQDAGYVSPHTMNMSVGSSTAYQRWPTGTVLPAEVSPDEAAARAFEDRISYLLDHGGFLAMTIAPRPARDAANELTKRFGVVPVSFDELLIDAMVEQAESLGVGLDVVLEADRSATSSADWRNLLRLVSRSALQVKERLLRSDRPLLITDPGLLGRYDLMPLLTELQTEAGRPQRTPAILLLVPMTHPDAPAIDGLVVPTTTSAHWARVPEYWVKNRHRSGVRA